MWNSEVTFRVKVDGFTMKGDPEFMQAGHAEFKHKYSAARVSFNLDQQIYTFNVEEGKMEEYKFELPPGEYIVDAEIPEASLYGQAAGSFRIVRDTISITELTDTVIIYAEANCSLIMISDELNHLGEGPFIIEKHSYQDGYFKSYPLAMDSASGMYYAYFTPDPSFEDPSAFLWFYGEKPGVEKGGMSTSRFEVGYQYYISILE
jgi:hypothetical protein